MKRINREVLGFIHEELELSVDREEVKELVEKLQNDFDFNQEIDGQDYRFISDGVIWDIYVEGIQEITEDCYVIKAPKWLAIDWEATAENCFVDGYGHHFNHYDGEEIEYCFNDEMWWIFRED